MSYEVLNRNGMAGLMRGKFVRLAVSVMLTITLVGCSVGVKRTAGMNLYASGKHSDAVPVLLAEVAAGNVEARYSLGLAYRDGVGVERDAAKAEVLLTGAAIGGDPRAVGELRKMLIAENRCPLDKRLSDRWGKINFMWRDFAGKVDFGAVPADVRHEMASIYDVPCPGRPVQAQSAQALREFTTRDSVYWVYLPG